MILCPVRIQYQFVVTIAQIRNTVQQETVAVQQRADMAASFQHVAVEQLAHRLKYATEWAREVNPEINTLVVAGGVAANKTLRARIEEVAKGSGYHTVYPHPRLCTDNGAQAHRIAQRTCVRRCC
jgi:tRNA A37 threonylcarbamoyltransferase TsaD